MAEQLDLTSAETTANVTNYSVMFLGLDRENAKIAIRVRSNAINRYKDFFYTGATATSLINSLNKANLTIKSLEKRVLEQLNTDGFLVGTVSGTPD